MINPTPAKGAELHGTDPRQSPSLRGIGMNYKPRSHSNVRAVNKTARSLFRRIYGNPSLWNVLLDGSKHRIFQLYATGLNGPDPAGSANRISGIASECDRGSEGWVTLDRPKAKKEDDQDGFHRSILALLEQVHGLVSRPPSIGLGRLG